MQSMWESEKMWQTAIQTKYTLRTAGVIIDNCTTKQQSNPLRSYCPDLYYKLAFKYLQCRSQFLQSAATANKA